MWTLKSKDSKLGEATAVAHLHTVDYRNPA